MKKVALLLMLMAIFVVGITSAQAYTIVPGSGDYAVGDVIGGWQVLDYKDAVPGNSNGIWTISGASGGGYTAHGSLMWFYSVGNYAQVTFDVKSTAVAFMLQSDWNDGIVDLSVDGVVFAHNFDMQNDLPGNEATLIISGLNDGYHTIKIQSVGYVAADINDFHIYGGAAVAPVAAPEPASLLLLGLGLLGLASIRKRS